MSDEYFITDTTWQHPKELPGEDYKEVNDGGSASYYQLPEDAKELQDVIEAKSMTFAQGNVFKAVYRMNDKGHHSNQLRDWKKIMWFAQREINRLEKYDCNQI